MVKKNMRKKIKITLKIYYTDGELVQKGFETLQKCLDYLKTEIVEKNEFADEIKISLE